MCSIFGIVGEYDINRAREAFESLSHRGEDSSKIVNLIMDFLLLIAWQ